MKPRLHWNSKRIYFGKMHSFIEQQNYSDAHITELAHRGQSYGFPWSCKCQRLADKSTAMLSFNVCEVEIKRLRCWRIHGLLISEMFSKLMLSMEMWRSILWWCTQLKVNCSKHQTKKKLYKQYEIDRIHMIVLVTASDGWYGKFKRWGLVSARSDLIEWLVINFFWLMFLCW